MKLKTINLLLLIFIILCLSCNNKKEEINQLFMVEESIGDALKSHDITFIENVINKIEAVEKIFPEHQSLKEKKYTLQIRLKDYEGAIKTIDSLLLISPDDVDNRIVQGILYEIIGEKHNSVLVLEKTLELIDMRIKKMLKGDTKKWLNRELNRLILLKLLEVDIDDDYTKVRNIPEISLYPELLSLTYIIEDGDREQIINRYR